MRIILIGALAALSLTACNETSETYPLEVSTAYSKLSGAGYSAASYGLPGALSAMGVNVTFQSFPDRTASWKFTHKGKELARIDAAVEGDSESSTISYSYAKGDAAGEFEKLEHAVRTYSRPLIIEGMDAQIEGRPMDLARKDDANARIATALIGEMMGEAANKLRITDEQRAKWDQQDREHEARVMEMQEERLRHMSAKSTQPTTQLGGN